VHGRTSRERRRRHARSARANCRQTLRESRSGIFDARAPVRPAGPVIGAGWYLGRSSRSCSDAPATSRSPSHAVDAVRCCSRHMDWTVTCSKPTRRYTTRRVQRSASRLDWSQRNYRRNHLMGSVRRVPSNFGDHGDQMYLLRPTFTTGCHFRWALWEAPEEGYEKLTSLGPRYFVRFWTGCVVMARHFSRHVRNSQSSVHRWEAYGASPDQLAKFKGRRKEE